MAPSQQLFAHLAALSRIHCASILPPPSLLRCGKLLSAVSTTVRVRSFSSSRQLWSEDPSSKPFSYAISASFSAKHKAWDSKNTLYVHDSHNSSALAITEKNWNQRQKIRPQSGQDAFFVANIGTFSDQNGIAFGVVDGVGGWESSGVDPADFAHSLCEYMAQASTDYPESFGGSSNAPHPLRPLQLLELGYESVLSDARITAGGSTACIGVASPSGVLEVANLGDSGYAQVSPFRLQAVSAAQTHAFNTPFQLSKVPRRMAEQAQLFGGVPLQDYPADSALSTLRLCHGDVVVFASDGVWDNLSPADILQTTCRVMVGMEGWVRSKSGEVGIATDFAALALRPSEGKTLGLSAVLASTIAKEAKEASLDDRRDGPFAKEVQRLFPKEHWRGGKADDVCAVVIVACQE